MILHRYILSQILWPILLVFFSLNLLFLLVQLLKVGEVTFGAGLGLKDLFRVSLLFLPGLVVFTVPISVLTGVLLGFGRMAGDGEIVGLAGAGVSGVRLAAMPLAVGIVAGCLAGSSASFLAPASAEALQRVFGELTRRHVAASLRAGRFFEDIPRVVLYPHHVGKEKNSFDGFLLHDCRADRPCHAVVARHARVSPSTDRNALELVLQDGEVHGQAEDNRLYSIGRFSEGTVNMDIDWLVSGRTRFIPEIDRMPLSALAAEARNPARTPRERNVMSAAWHRRFAFPFSSVLFALLGTVLAASGKLKGWRGNLTVSVGAIAAYYLLMRCGDALVEGGILLPPLAAWLPDIFLVGIVLVRLYRIERRAG